MRRFRTSNALMVPRKRVFFLCGWATVGIALTPPLGTLDHHLLIAHMLQHLLLMTVAAPLLLLGAPDRLPLPAGLHPAICWWAGTGVVMFWHVPALFALGMSSGVWHAVEHFSFLAAGLFFWWPILQPPAEPQPSMPRMAPWAAPLYLFLATLPCDALSAFLTFCDRVVYPSYAAMPDRPFGLSALQDQQWAGTIMWVWVTFAYLAPAALIAMDLLSPPTGVRQPLPRSHHVT